MVNFCVKRKIDKCLVYIPLDTLQNITDYGNPTYFVENFMKIAGDHNLSVGILSPLDYTLMYAQYYNQQNPGEFIKGGYAKTAVNAMADTDYSNDLSNYGYKEIPKGSNNIAGALPASYGFCPYDSKGKAIPPSDNMNDLACPNQIEQLIQFAADVNILCNKKGLLARVTWFAIDGEDIGAYVVDPKAAGATKGFFAQFWYAMVTILGPTIGLSGDDLKLPITAKAKAALSAGQAHGYGDNATDDGTNISFPELYWISPPKDKPEYKGWANEVSRAPALIKWDPTSLIYPTANNCVDKKGGYTGPESCTWKDPNMQLSDTYHSLCDQDITSGCSIQCKGCKTIDDSAAGTTGDGCSSMCAASSFSKGKCYVHNDDCQSSSDDFDGCMAGGQGGGCLGCVPCVDNTLPNYGDVATLYMKYLNQPQALLVAMSPFYDQIKSLGSGDGTVPMFSIEHSHEFCQGTDTTNCGLPAGSTGALQWAPYATALEWPNVPNYNSNGCAQKKYTLLESQGKSDANCGTFPGLGMWSWEAFESFLDLFAAKYNVKEIAIYEWAFVPPNWQ
jgi:hypothetical protein